MRRARMLVRRAEVVSERERKGVWGEGRELDWGCGSVGGGAKPGRGRQRIWTASPSDEEVGRPARRAERKGA